MHRRYLPGALIAFLDLITGGIFLLFYMPRVQLSIERETGKKATPYWAMYLLGIPCFFLTCVFWISFRAKELQITAKSRGITKKTTSFAHMFLWNIPGILTFVGPLIATQRFFDTLEYLEASHD